MVYAVCAPYDKVAVYYMAAARNRYEIILAVGASATVAAFLRHDISFVVECYRVAGNSSHLGKIISNTVCIDYIVAPADLRTGKPVHHHAVAGVQSVDYILGRYTVDGEGKAMDCQYDSQRYSECRYEI